ncbi:MAG: ribulose-phosphate 3-epimerase [Saprospiraceae bacterium]|jgi:ribulose-phosphate 3-epimerase|nr:ribulose-phosphate 3-epimerase [Saprospiraceae bacterium]
MKHLIAPSVLAADFSNLKKDFDMINQSNADWYHVDVMDGRFVPNISFGMNIVKTMKQMAEKPLDVHLMIVEPDKYLEEFRNAGADVLTVHYEASPHLHRTLGYIKELGAKAGVAINPHTPVDLLDDVLELTDMVCIMSVNPGFGGQKFIYQTLSKIKRLKAKIIERNLDTLIEIDGGVGLQNAEEILKAGADVLVAGSSVFKSEDPIDTIDRLKNIGR